MDKLVFDIEKIVREAGKIILTAERKNLNIEYKEGIGNFATYYDKKIQMFLKEKLLELIPKANFIGEEEDIHEAVLNEGYTFIVDPIDGTTNFVRNISMSMISVGLLKDGIVLTGSAPYYEDLREKTVSVLTNLISVANDFRRLGSAAYELCLVAAGRFELQFELRLQPWDVAASSLILEEAGGKVTDINGEKISFDAPTSILATNNQENYLEYIKDIF